MIGARIRRNLEQLMTISSARTIPLAALLAAACLGAAVSAGSIAFGSADRGEWTVSASLPLGAEYRLLHEDAKSGGIHALVRFPGRYVLPKHAHEANETLLVLRGKLRITSGAADRVLAAGDYALVPPGLDHELSVEGRKGVILLVTTDGPYSFKPKP